VHSLGGSAWRRKGEERYREESACEPPWLQRESAEERRRQRAVQQHRRRRSSIRVDVGAMDASRKVALQQPWELALWSGRGAVVPWGCAGVDSRWQWRWWWRWWWRSRRGRTDGAGDGAGWLVHRSCCAASQCECWFALGDLFLAEHAARSDAHGAHTAEGPRRRAARKVARGDSEARRRAAAAMAAESDGGWADTSRRVE